MQDSRPEGGTYNELIGDSGGTVQAGVVHGDIVINHPNTDRPTPPRQLPMDIAIFVNRELQLARLNDLINLSLDPMRKNGPAVVISTIAGAPGIGKTALAVHWAHSVRNNYEDGDLYIDMRGYGPGTKLEVDQALDAFLRALNVAPEQIPVDSESRASLYRSTLDGKRILILIDNASSVKQVRSLLPASSGCTAIITSRNSLSGLVAREGAIPMVLDVLSQSESLELLRQIVGEQRIDSELATAERLVERCAYLPLALRIVAERIVSRPYTTLAEIGDELRDERERLDALGIDDDEMSNIRAVFSSSYRSLDVTSRRMFRLLGLHPGPEFSIPVAAALANIDLRTARRLLDGLADGHLLQRVSSERYRFHDLLKSYAIERANHDESSENIVNAVRRVSNWYLHSVYRGHKIILPSFHAVPLDDTELSVPRHRK